MLRRKIGLILIALFPVLAACQTISPLDNFPKAPISNLDKEKTIERIAFGSCLPDTSDVKIFETILKSKPDIFFMIGDNVYGDFTPQDPQQSGMRASYWQLSKNPAFINLAQNVPTFASWDDHDFGDNDAGKNFPFKKLTENMFEKFWNLEASEAAKRDGIYQSFSLGSADKIVQFIILDTRFFRDNPVLSDDVNVKGKERYMPHTLDSKATILGEKQWKWLEGELKKPAQIRIIISSIQLIANGNGWEAWEKFPAERNKFYEIIKSTQADGVIIFSGDRHHASINKYEGNPYPLYDFTASPFSGLANNGEKEIAPNRIYVSPKGILNFGEVEINWDLKIIKLNLYNNDGAKLNSYEIEMDMLKTKKAPN